MIVVVDDLHLTDEASLGVLHSVLRRAGLRAVIAIFAAREAELSQSVQATALQHAMSRLGGRVISLKPLSEFQTRGACSMTSFKTESTLG